MRESEIEIAPYRTVFEQSPAAFALLEVLRVEGRYDDFRFIYVNKGYERLSGYPVERLTGHTYSEVCGQKSSQWNELYGGVAFEGGERSTIEYGSEIGRYVNIQCHQVRPGFCAVLALDVNDPVLAMQRATRGSERKYELERQRTLHDSSIMAYAIFDLQRHETLELVRNQQLAPIAADATLEAFRDDVAACIVVEEQKRQYLDAFEPAHLLEAFRQGKEEQFVQFLRRLPSGKVIWVKARFYLMEEPNSADTLLFYSCTDINAHKALEIMTSYIVEEDYDMLGSINLADDSALLWRGRFAPAGHPATVGPQEEERYSEALCDFLALLSDPQERECYRAALCAPALRQRLAAGDCLAFTVHMRYDGRMHTKEIRFSRYDYNTDVCMFTQTDITELLEAKEKEKRALEEALRKMEQANAAQSDFLAKMSHELRTPLNVIIGSSALASDQPRSDPTTQEYVQQIDYSAKYLLSMINDILDARKMERGEFKLQCDWVRPATVLPPALTMMASEFKNRGIEFLFEENCTIDPNLEYFLDVVRCRQIVTNLLNNALKFTSAGGSVSFYDEHLERDENRAWEKFIIRDTGCGMSREFQTRMFEPFAQEHKVGFAAVQGTGLGLAVVKQLVDEMKGTIAVESAPGQGTTFTIVIPFAWRRAARTAQPDAAYDPALLAGRHILLVEDHPMNVTIAKRLLEKKGVLVDTAANGAEGVAAFEGRAEPYDAILMDIRMPVMDGLEAARRIRASKQKGAATVPIVAMTANAYAEDVQKSLAAGMTAHLAKPIDPLLLYKTLAHLLSAAPEVTCQK